jgi:hypothetical protein
MPALLFLNYFLYVQKVNFLKAVKIILNPKQKVNIAERKEDIRISYQEYSELIKKAKKNVFGN